LDFGKTARKCFLLFAVFPSEADGDLEPVPDCVLVVVVESEQSFEEEGETGVQAIP